MGVDTVPQREWIGNRQSMPRGNERWRLAQTGVCANDSEMHKWGGVGNDERAWTMMTLVCVGRLDALSWGEKASALRYMACHLRGEKGTIIVCNHFFLVWQDHLRVKGLDCE